jgi:hypothetical protein
LLGAALAISRALLAQALQRRPVAPTLNKHLKKAGSPLRYKFNCLTESGFNKYFQALRDGTIEHFRSDLDANLPEEES